MTQYIVDITGKDGGEIHDWIVATCHSELDVWTCDEDLTHEAYQHIERVWGRAKFPDMPTVPLALMPGSEADREDELRGWLEAQAYWKRQAEADLPAGVWPEPVAPYPGFRIAIYNSAWKLWTPEESQLRMRAVMADLVALYDPDFWGPKNPAVRFFFSDPREATRFQLTWGGR